MASFREQMQELVAKIARSRQERQQAVAEFPKFHDQLRRQVKRQRDETRRDLQTAARDQARELSNFNSQNQRSVARLLRETRTSRVHRSQAARARLQRELGQNRQSLLRSLRQNHTDRKRMSRSVSRQSLQAIQAVQTRVQNLRSGTGRLIRSLASDRAEGRRLWASLRSSTRPAAHELRSAVPTKRATNTVTNLAISAAGSLGELSGLAMPPARA